MVLVCCLSTQKMQVLSLLLFFYYLTDLDLIFTQNLEATAPPCESPIYCHGDLLHTIQLAKVFNDSKTFVDKKLIYPVNKTLARFKCFMNATNENPDKKQVQDFISQHFEDGNELENWVPQDFNPEPSFVKEISNETLRNFTRDLIAIWPLLAKKVKGVVIENLEHYSLIPVPNGFIVPGGRFREYYYWDSYWIIQGLLISEMTETARGMLDNFLSLVERFGFIPNGGRLYYLNRSQPPLLTAMAFEYFKKTNDVDWLKKSVAFLDQELHFWLANRTIDVPLEKNTFTLAHYFVHKTGPRPESYYEDYTLAEHEDPLRKAEMYMELKSGAESGWDYSARWFFDRNEVNHVNLSNIDITRIIPVDLNAILCGAFQDMAKLYLELNDLEKASFWITKAAEWRKAIQFVLWNEEDGVWYDFDLKQAKARKHFYPSNVAPLWTKCFEPQEGPKLGKRVTKYLESRGILNYLGGIPSSLQQTGEQWDFPNAWPPLQDIVVDGLESSGSPEAQEMARELATRWVRANLIGYSKTGDMFEKYDAVIPGLHGGGGEYVVQKGFGWSNGVVLKFIYDYFRNV